ncbi:MAG TPA: FAD-binding oxidoreductase [Myxococcales bacterium]|nr:FAD-binding oxidoreductase [Myxococcales bacterium]
MTESWGRYPQARHAREVPLAWRADLMLPATRPLLAYGQGRSYGDSCLNDGGTLLRTAGLDRFISLDDATGVLRCEAGITLGEILRLTVPRGLFLPVVPGTKYVSVGGAIANDIHGKNHHRKGTFGAHVRRLELLRSDGQRQQIGPGDPLFAATIAGLGLTGLITWAEIELSRISIAAIRSEAIPFAGLDEFLALSDESDAQFEYTVAWLDVFSSAQRGIFFRGDHAQGSPSAPRIRTSVPVDVPLVNGATVRAFNAAYRAAQKVGGRSRLQHWDPFLFPLDGVGRWNRLYGRRGFLQFQCVVPTREALAELLRDPPPSPLTVLKRFGGTKSPGLMSFPRPGFTLTFDLPNHGEETFARFARLEKIAIEAGGALYPAKDACMSRESFERSFPLLPEFARHLDPAFSSSFWRRVTR